MKHGLIASGFLVALVLGIHVSEAEAQMDPENPPEPPVEQLAPFRPFLGMYTHSDMQYGGLAPWSGTLAVVPAVKGWYVEWEINTHHRAIDRQLRMMMTWDEELGLYRVWRFETSPQAPPERAEGTARFVGDTLVMRWENVPGPAGQPPASFRNRAFIDGADDLVIISEVLPENAGPIHLGEWRNKRRL